MSEQDFSINTEALEYAIKATPAERVYILNQSFPLWFCYYYVSYLGYPFADFHFEMFDDISKLMDGTYREVAWVAFRESAKTSIAKGFITWIICTDPVSYTHLRAHETG